MTGKPRKTRKKKDSSWLIAIPSYKRPDTLREKTLTILAQYKIPASKIFIFVADSSEEKEYKEKLLPGTYGKLIVGKPGLSNARNFISDYFPVGQKIVNIDDDIRGFVKWSATAHRNEVDLKDLVEVIERGFKECERSGATLWGLAAVANGFFMNPTVSTKLKYIIGSFWGCVNPGTSGPKGIKITLEDKEDFQRSILFRIRDGVVVRLNWISPKSAYFKEPGGMQEDRTRKRIEDSARWLVNTYPEYAVLNTRKKSGIIDVRLREPPKS